MGKKSSRPSQEEHPGPVILKPALPFIFIIPGGIFVGRLVRIRGFTHDSMEKFDLKLICGYKPTSDVALHIYFRREDQRIIINSIIGGNPGEEIVVAHMPLFKGQPFELFIICEKNGFRILLNARFHVEFPHRISIDKISYIAGDGDMRVSVISFESVKYRTSQLEEQPQPPTGPSGGAAEPKPSISGHNRNPYNRVSYDISPKICPTEPSSQGNSEKHRSSLHPRHLCQCSVCVPFPTSSSENTSLQLTGLSPGDVSITGNTHCCNEASGSNATAQSTNDDVKR